MLGSGKFKSKQSQCPLLSTHPLLLVCPLGAVLPPTGRGKAAHCNLFYSRALFPFITAQEAPPCNTTMEISVPQDILEGSSQGAAWVNPGTVSKAASAYQELKGEGIMRNTLSLKSDFLREERQQVSSIFTKTEGRENSPVCNSAFI